MIAVRRRGNIKIVVPCVLAIGIMLGLVAYSPTLYRLFCAATGFGGTTQRAYVDSAKVSPRMITVRFEASVAPGLPWRFEPDQPKVTVHLGEQQLVSFTAENLSDQAVIGHATFNVTPELTGAYFNKIQCFCFDDERLGPHQKVDMPVVFFVAPELAKDPDIHDLSAITLAYTFFRSAKPEDPKDLARFLPTADPDPVHGQELFRERCSACHSLDSNKAGPMLGNVAGRSVGSAPGYTYSDALHGADLTWTVENLIGGWPIPASSLPEQRCRSAFSILQPGETSLPISERRALSRMTCRRRRNHRLRRA